MQVYCNHAAANDSSVVRPTKNARAGRPKKYETEDEKLMARRIKNRQYQATYRLKKKAEAEEAEERFKFASAKAPAADYADTMRVVGDFTKIREEHGSYEKFIDYYEEYARVTPMSSFEHKYYMILTGKSKIEMKN